LTAAKEQALADAILAGPEVAGYATAVWTLHGWRNSSRSVLVWGITLVMFSICWGGLGSAASNPRGPRPPHHAPSLRDHSRRLEAG